MLRNFRQSHPVSDFSHVSNTNMNSGFSAVEPYRVDAAFMLLERLPS
jgi:hypothetical protein